jgi:hypothetical protein
MDSLLQMLSDWRFLLFIGILSLYGVSRRFKRERPSEDISSLVERFHNEIVAAEALIASDVAAAAAFAFESKHLSDAAVEPGAVESMEHAELPATPA